MGKQDQVADFERFGFDTDERWLKYLGSVEVTNPDPNIMRKLKAKWYKKVIVSFGRACTNNRENMFNNYVSDL